MWEFGKDSSRFEGRTPTHQAYIRLSVSLISKPKYLQHIVEQNYQSMIQMTSHAGVNVKNALVHLINFEIVYDSRAGCKSISLNAV